MKPRPDITILVRARGWRDAGIDVQALRRAAGLALERARGDGVAARALTILLTDDSKLCALNEKFRGKPAPTNVLSFPSAYAGDYLGDIAIAYGATAREAASAGKPLAGHLTHLAVHGVLHLLGYDHETPRQARAMEPLETAILDEMGIPDPYAVASIAE